LSEGDIENTALEKNGFEILGTEINEVLNQSKLKGKAPTPIQEVALKPILSKENTMIISQTGTGKTLAVMLPVFKKILETDRNPIKALYITPLKALNRDLLDRLVWWANKLEVEIAVRHGDTSPYQRRQQMEFPPHIMIVTLETLQPILTGKKIREHLRNIEFVILDEVHETVESKRGIQLALGLERLKKLSGDFQLIMLSATIGSPDRVANFYSAGQDVSIVRAETDKKFDIQVISPRPKPEDDEIVKSIYTSKETAARLRTIMEQIKEARSSLTFTNTREFAEILQSRIKTIDTQFPSEIHHSSLSKGVRIKTEKRFKAEEIKSIICTSSLQLGIDIGTIDTVVQYMSPRKVSQLIQRVGRAGHGIERVSRGIVVATDEDDCFEAAVVARRALAGEIEPTKSHINSLDVLAHQIVGMTIENWKVGLKKTYEDIIKAGPYSSMSFDDFTSVVRQLAEIGLIYYNVGEKGEEIKKKRRGFSYYFGGLSTIPDVKQYKIFNMIDQSFVGVLDDEFVSVHGDPGTTFIVKGEPWRIVETEDDKVLVEPSNDVDAAVPGWEGELIPVHFDVAQEVGRLRRHIFEMLGKMTPNETVEQLMDEYPVDKDVARKMVNFIKRQRKHDKKMITDDKNILVEDFQDIVVLHTCFGSVSNQTFGRFLAALLTSRLGSVGLKTDPYRILIQFQKKSENNKKLIEEIIQNTKPEHLKSYIRLSVSKSDLFQYKFVHVAKRFGAFSRDAQLSRTKLKSVIEDYAVTPLFEETMKEIETEKLDVERATELLQQIQTGKMKLHFKSGISPIGKIGIKHKYAEVIGPERPTKEIFEIFKHRILNTEKRLACLNCGKWSQRYTIRDMPLDVHCPKCSAIMLGIVHPRQTNITKIIQKHLKKKHLAPDEQELLKRAQDTVELYMTHKRDAAIILAGRGVGPYTAKKLLRKYHETVDDLMKDVLEAEKQFQKTKKYWKI
jgi:ATP-dependent Lhr-like helicase